MAQIAPLEAVRWSESLHLRTPSGANRSTWSHGRIATFGERRTKNIKKHWKKNAFFEKRAFFPRFRTALARGLRSRGDDQVPPVRRMPAAGGACLKNLPPSNREARLMPTFRRSLSVLMASLLGLLAADRPALATVLSQVTTGITHSGGGESGVIDQIGFSTSGGPSGPAQANLSLQIDAPSGQAFQFDSTAYPDVDFDFLFRPIVSGDLTGMTAANPSFELLNPTGSVAVTFFDSSVGNVGDVQFTFSSTYEITGTGTFSGFRMNTTLTGFSGQTLQWGGGDGDVRSVGYSGSDEGPMLTLVTVPEPVPMLPLAAVALAALAVRRLGRPQSGPLGTDQESAVGGAEPRRLV